MARRGQAFKTHHIHLVLSDPRKDPKRVVIVNVTSCKDAADRARVDCIRRGEHPALERDSYVSFVHPKVVDEATLDRALAEKRTEPVADFPLELLNRICRAAASARELAANVRAVLKDQGLVP